MSSVAPKRDLVNGNGSLESHGLNGEKEPLHRIASVRKQQGISLRCAARQLEKEVSQVRVEEEETSDLQLSDIYAWQSVLNVPIADLLMDPETPLSRPVLERARLVRLMKTAAAIHEEAKSVGVRRLAERLVDQLIEIMPELEEVGAWHAVGQRRSLDDYGRVFELCISEDILFQHNNGHHD